MDRAGLSAAEDIIEALYGVVDPGGSLFYDWAVVAAARLSPTVGALPAALNEHAIWDESRRGGRDETPAGLSGREGQFRRGPPGRARGEVRALLRPALVGSPRAR